MLAHLLMPQHAFRPTFAQPFPPPPVPRPSVSDECVCLEPPLLPLMQQLRAHAACSASALSCALCSLQQSLRRARTDSAFHQLSV